MDMASGVCAFPYEHVAGAGDASTLTSGSSMLIWVPDLAHLHDLQSDGVQHPHHAFMA